MKRTGNAGLLAALAMSLGATFEGKKKKRGLGIDSIVSPYPLIGRRTVRRYGPNADCPLTLRSVDPSQHNTLRLDQVERARKLAKKKGRAAA